MLELIKPFNFILACDSYKCGHWQEIPPYVKKSYSVIVPRRGSEYSTVIVAMGQTLLAATLAAVRITDEMIDEAEIEITEQGYTFNRAGWEHIVTEHDGRLPLAVYGVEEGRIVNPQTPIVGVVNTDDKSAWLPAYVETFAQPIVWKMSTVATICRTVRTTMHRYMELSGSDMSMLDWKLQNFGDRGADSPDDAPVMAGIAHAALFNGSDCTRANGYIKRMYGTAKPYTSSVEATEHSVMCAHSDPVLQEDWGAACMAVDRLEAAVVRSKQGIGVPVLSCVIDTYDSRRFVQDYIGTRLKDRIINSGGQFVCRPDSGDPTVEPGMVGQDLVKAFGSTTNAAGFTVLPSCVGVIQGDGNRIDTFEDIIRGWVIDNNFSLDNFLLGMGSGITHDGARDDFSFSMKTVADTSDGTLWRRLSKNPITDRNKKSLSGLVRCTETETGELKVFDALQSGLPVYNFADFFEESGPGWQCWFKDGRRVFRQSFDDVRARARVM